jgi:cytochrome c oxidase subunit 4
MVLAATTTGVAFLPLGHWHTAVAVTIAVVKATLVVLFFMHALESGRLVHLIIIAALFCLAIMMAFVLCDYWSRWADLLLRNPPMQ